VHNLFRFAINSTLGIAGLFDPATSMGLEARDSDFGQTLHVWGVGEGAFVEMPVFGPRTERDAWGTVVDIALNPTRIILPADVPTVEARAVQLVDARHSFGSTIDGVLYDSADSYALSRSIYLQNRRFFLAEGQSDVYFDPYDDFLED
jgi:phospholipid-binding lipoprotein MlaA